MLFHSKHIINGIHVCRQVELIEPPKNADGVVIMQLSRDYFWKNENNYYLTQDRYIFADGTFTTNLRAFRHKAFGEVSKYFKEQDNDIHLMSDYGMDGF